MDAAWLLGMSRLCRAARGHQFRGLGQTDHWTVAIVRTDVGASIWAAAEADGVITFRPVQPDDLLMDQLNRMSTIQRSRRQRSPDREAADRAPVRS